MENQRAARRRSCSRHRKSSKLETPDKLWRKEHGRSWKNSKECFRKLPEKPLKTVVSWRGSRKINKEAIYKLGWDWIGSRAYSEFRWDQKVFSKKFLQEKRLSPAGLETSAQQCPLTLSGWLFGYYRTNFQAFPAW